MQLTILLQNEVRAIHQATLRMLSEVGVFLDDDKARALLLDHGAREHHKRTSLPSDLVETCSVTPFYQPRPVGSPMTQK